jgi:hypothetical protein
MCEIPKIYDLNDQLQTVNEFRRHQDQIAWIVFSIFWAVYGLLLATLFQNSNDVIIDPVQGIIITTFSIILSIIWYFIEYRAICFLVFYESQAAELEKQLQENGQIEPRFRTVWTEKEKKAQNNKEYEKSSKIITGFPVKPIMRITPFTGIFCWSLGFGYFIVLRYPFINIFKFENPFIFSLIIAVGFLAIFYVILKISGKYPVLFGTTELVKINNDIKKRN